MPANKTVKSTKANEVAVAEKILKAQGYRVVVTGKSVAAERGYLIGLDGRRLPIRSAHAALNTLLQSAGALISKRWWLECFIEAGKKGLKYGWDGDFTCLGYIHDELQWAVREEKAEEFGEMVVAAAATAGEFYNFKCPIGAEFKIGRNWCDTH